MAESDDDDAPPVATSSKRSRNEAVAVDAEAPTRQSIARAQREARKKQQRLVTEGLRDDDYLPPEILSQLPATSAARGAGSGTGEAALKQSRTESKAAKRRGETGKVQANDGLPKVVQRVNTVEVAVLPEAGMRGARLHAPIKADAKAFLQEQLFGSRHQRVSASTLSSMKPTGGRFGAASNFATVPLEHQKETPGAHKKGSSKRKGSATELMAGRSTLEQMAARIMRKKR